VSDNTEGREWLGWRIEMRRGWEEEKAEMWETKGNGNYIVMEVRWLKGQVMWTRQEISFIREILLTVESRLKEMKYALRLTNEDSSLQVVKYECIPNEIYHDCAMQELKKRVSRHLSETQRSSLRLSPVLQVTTRSLYTLLGFWDDLSKMMVLIFVVVVGLKTK